MNWKTPLRLYIKKDTDMLYTILLPDRYIHIMHAKSSVTIYMIVNMSKGVGVPSSTQAVQK